MKLFFAFVILLTGLYGCNNQSNPVEKDDAELVPATPILNYAVTKFFPHDISLYTEGLLIHDGRLFESTGSPTELRQTKSVIGIVDLLTGKMDTKIEIDKAKYFGEGIAVFNDKLYQLTYKTQVGFIYDISTFKPIGQFSYANKEGWSLTTNSKGLIMSDGTDKLFFLDAVNVKPTRILSVTENSLPVDNLNELEFIKGYIYANIWRTNFIVKIDPANGKVVARLDLSSLVFEAKNKNPAADVLNGIAYDSVSDKVYVTGKLWANIYQIEFQH